MDTDSPPPADAPSAKRGHEDDAAEDEARKRRLPDPDAVDSLPSISMRALITSKDAGVVIGRQGKNVADVREQSGARITVSEQIHGSTERILTISGPLDAVAKAVR